MKPKPICNPFGKIFVASTLIPFISCANNETEEEGPFNVPNVVGMNLQGAQDCLQSYGFYNIDDQPASGEPRFQVNDSNWTVVGQDRTEVFAKDDRITLRAKKRWWSKRSPLSLNAQLVYFK